MSDWMQTMSGRAVYPLDLQPEDICIEDIAHSLAKQTRYAGHTKDIDWHYSIAQHCVYVSQNVSPCCALDALLHDASEAYFAELHKPVKIHMTVYRVKEKKAQRVIRKKFGLAEMEPPEVKRIDTAILGDERDQLMSEPPQDWNLPYPPLGITIERWTSRQARDAFLSEFNRLYKPF